MHGDTADHRHREVNTHTCGARGVRHRLPHRRARRATVRVDGAWRRWSAAVLSVRSERVVLRNYRPKRLSDFGVFLRCMFPIVAECAVGCCSCGCCLALMACCSPCSAFCIAEYIMSVMCTFSELTYACTRCTMNLIV